MPQARFLIKGRNRNATQVKEISFWLSQTMDIRKMQIQITHEYKNKKMY